MQLLFTAISKCPSRCKLVTYSCPATNLSCKLSHVQVHTQLSFLEEGEVISSESDQVALLLRKLRSHLKIRWENTYRKLTLPTYPHVAPTPLVSL